MGVTFELKGLDELRKALSGIPDRLKPAVDDIVESAARDTAQDLLAVYPSEGIMRLGVFVIDMSDRWKSKWQVQSRTAEATWWEFGTQNRFTKKLWNRGSAPAHPDTGLISIAKRHRRTMRERLVQLVEDEGFKVDDRG